MEGTLRVDPQTLISTADEFNTINSQIKSLTDNMLETVRSLNGIWEGEAAAAYGEKFGQRSADMDKISRMINEHVSDLNEMARRYMEAEKGNTDEGTSLPGNAMA